MRPYVIALLALLSAPLLALAQDQRVVFYEHEDFRGESFVLVPGQYIADLGDFERGFFGEWDNDIDSIAFPQNASTWITVRVWELPNYEGRTLDLHFSEGDLGLIPLDDGSIDDWHDEISSIAVYSGMLAGWTYDYGLDSYLYLDGEWIYHNRGLGWMVDVGYDRFYGQGWLWDAHYGAIYADRASFPWIWVADARQWIYYFPDTANPRWFWNPQTQQAEFSYSY